MRIPELYIHIFLFSIFLLFCQHSPFFIFICHILRCPIPNFHLLYPSLPSLFFLSFLPLFLLSLRLSFFSLFYNNWMTICCIYKNEELGSFTHVCVLNVCNISVMHVYVIYNDKITAVETFHPLLYPHWDERHG